MGTVANEPWFCSFYLLVFGCAGSSLMRGHFLQLWQGALGVMRRLLLAMVSLVVEHGLSCSAA